MISAVLRMKRADIPILTAELKDEAAFYTDEDLSVVTILTGKDFEALLAEKPLADIICVDISTAGGIHEAERLRAAYARAAIIIIADVDMSPVTYMKPGIMASSLLLFPITRESVHGVMEDIFRQYIRGNRDEEVFKIETRVDTWRVPVADILYFESREKKVYACTRYDEYGFYDTLDSLEERMGESFVRCHRSYMVNISCVDRLMPSKNVLLLKQGMDLPLSRSYKSLVRERLNGPA